jgi:hypothetical protein
MHEMGSVESSIDDQGAFEWVHRVQPRNEVTMPASVLQVKGDDIIASVGIPNENDWQPRSAVHAGWGRAWPA